MVSHSARLPLLVSAALFFASTLPGLASAQTVSFQAATNYRVGDHPQCVALGDFNRDGIRDLAVSNSASNTVSVLLGNGDGTFQAARTLATGAGPNSVTVDDFNGDGIQDLATGDFQGNTISVLLGNGDGTFASPVAFPAGGTNPNFVAVGDFNRDGLQDLAVANYGGGTSDATTVAVLLGNGNGTFQAARTFVVQRSPLWVSVGDFNRDGLQDLAVVNYNADSVSVLLGNGDGTFRAALNFPTGAISGPASTEVGDFNGDGVPDLAVANFLAGQVAVALGNGDGTFRPVVTYATDRGPADVAAADFNGDGIQDLALPNWDGNTGQIVSVLLGKGDGTFLPAQNVLAGAGAVAVAVDDFNGDGALDMAVADYGSGFVSILINSTVPTPTNSLTVSKAGTGSGTVTSSPTGIACGVTCSASYNAGTVVTLTAGPAADSTFAGWNGAGCSGTGACTVTMTAATTVTATFTRQTFPLTVDRAGTGSGTVTSSPAGINCGATCSASYDSGTVVTLTAAAAGDSTFTGWSGGGCAGTGVCTVTMTAATTVTATFTRQTFPLTVDRAGTGSGTVTSSPAGIACGAACSASYDSGTVVTLTAAAAVGSTFTGWSGGGCLGTNACEVTMNAATTVTATFTRDRFTLTVTKASVLGVANGTVTSSPAGINCGSTCSATWDGGTSVTLTATPDPLSVFVGWSGGGCSGTGTCTVTLEANTTVTASFRVLGII
jgi:hypothetical protein